MVKALDRAWNEYNDVVQRYALERFMKIVKPWLVKNRCSFLAGNGTWLIFDNEKDYYEEALPKFILDELTTEIPGMPGNSLGSIMPDYRETDQ